MSRRPHDYYPTQPWPTFRLVRAVDKYVRPTVGLDLLRLWPVLDPFAGDGAILRQVGMMGCHQLHAWELDRSHDPTLSQTPHLTSLHYGDTLEREPDMDITVLTNPPYSLAYQAVKHFVHDHPVAMAAFLLPLRFMQAKRRAALLSSNPPSFIFVLAERPDFKGDGASADIGYAWYVWLRDDDNDHARTYFLPLETTERASYPV